MTRIQNLATCVDIQWTFGSIARFYWDFMLGLQPTPRPVADVPILSRECFNDLCVMAQGLATRRTSLRINRLVCGPQTKVNPLKREWQTAINIVAVPINF